MKVLTATRDTQGHVEGDYSFTVDGELVTPLAVECSAGPSCGCDRGFPGLASSRATSTAKVVDLRHITTERLRQAVRDSLHRDGWSKCLSPWELEDMVEEHVQNIRKVCRSFPVGAVVRRRGLHIFAIPMAA